MRGANMVTVPASFVNLLRETVVTQLTDCAIEIRRLRPRAPRGP